jgi:hypothetical protein
MRLRTSTLALGGLLLLGLGTKPQSVQAQITVYGQIPLAQTRSAANAATPTLAAYNDTELVPPPLPTALTRDLNINLQRDAGTVSGLSIPHKTASFFGFSIEMSVINQVCEWTFPPFGVGENGG